ncbi:MAG: 3-deoxy-8-phosphooctulonate synthase [Deltaproteobacteria bacterium]|nr:3-deoxy-8-phosphooctulonate synthase [Deltaproteobacteria bacterium]
MDRPYVAAGAFRAGSVLVGGPDLVLLAGPCVLETREAALRSADFLAEVCRRLGVPFVFKASFDKANRTSPGAFRGPGLETGLAWLRAVRDTVGVPVTTDVHLPAQAALAAEAVDLLQVPAFLCRQSDLVEACAHTGRPVNVKKGPFLAPGAMAGVVDRLRGAGAAGILLTERGTSFGHGDLVVDYRGLPVLRALGVPVCMDATHACQRPPLGDTASGGDRSFAAPLARAAVAVGVDAIFLEVHEDPDRAPSDAASMLPFSAVEPLLRSLLALRAGLARADDGREPQGPPRGLDMP